LAIHYSFGFSIIYSELQSTFPHNNWPASSSSKDMIF